MGTRNLTCVVKDGEYKVAQYGQWDGYPEGHGLTILRFISDKNNLDKFKLGLEKVRFLDYDGKDKNFVEEYNKACPKYYGDQEKRTPEQVHWFETYKSRDIGAKILRNIADSKDEEIILVNNLEFAADSLFCEWAYVVDFDKNTFEVYKGYNKHHLDDGERFKDMKGEDGYHPVAYICSFDLDDLPSEDEFLNKFKDEEESTD